MQARAMRIRASVGSTSPASGTSSTRTSPAPCMTVALMGRRLPAGAADQISGRGFACGGARRHARGVNPEERENLALLRRARDLMDREYSRPLEVAELARAALMSPA